jgi:ATP-dependent exoDNAse (exonuclease V) alpha subunit
VIFFVQQQDLLYLWGAASEPNKGDAETCQQQVDAFYTLRDIIGWSGSLTAEQDGSGDVGLDAAVSAAAATAESGGGAAPGVPCIALSDLNAKQKAFVDEVLRMVQRPQRAAYDYEMPRVVFLRGGPGTGKTATMQVLLSLLDAAGESMLVGATTAAAAQRLNRPGQADTVDALMGLWVGREFGMLPFDSETLKNLEAAHVCFCDEFSMLTYDKLMYIKHRMRMATRAGQPIKLLVLSGDEQQLPPVCRHKLLGRLGYCKKCHVCTTDDWQTARHLELTEVYRQAKDHPFMHFLNASRSRTPTASNIAYVLGDCCQPDGCVEDVMCEGVTVLCTHNDLVQDSNSKALQWHLQHGFLGSDIYAVSPDTDAWMCADIKSWVEKHHLLTSVAVGAPVVFNFNTRKSIGCVNSARGVVSAVHTDLGGEHVEALTVKLVATGRQVTVRRTVVKRMWHDGHSFFLKTFPLQLAYAVTAHKSQGMTLAGRVVLRIIVARNVSFETKRFVSKRV